MAGLLGAFKRLFSSKKSQEVPDVDDQSDDNVTSSKDGDDIDPCMEVKADSEIVDITSGDNITSSDDMKPSTDDDDDVKPSTATADDGDEIKAATNDDIKVSTTRDSVISTGSDWEVLSSSIGNKSNVEGTDVDSQDVDVKILPDDNKSVNVDVKVEKTDDSENIEAMASDEIKQEDSTMSDEIKEEDGDMSENSKATSNTGIDDGTKSTDCPDNKTDKTSNTGASKSGNKEQKICFYFNSKKGCRYKRCHFAHVLNSDSTESKDAETDSKPPHYINEKDFPDYLEFVREMTKHKQLVMAKDLVYKLGYMKGANSTTIGDAISGQYKIAKSRHFWSWMKEARYYSGLFFEQDWINENLCEGNRKQNKNKKNKKAKSNKNDNYEGGLGICRDVRLKDNPNLETVTANAAGDGPLIPKQNVVELGKRNTATGDGNNDSMSDTPSKRCKIAKLDVSRTPRSRPEQLAIGFNYHSDLVVKESPMTADGEIILDGETRPVLKSDNDKISTPGGTVQSPLRQVCNQLAFGFNYHSDIVAKDSPKMSTVDGRKKVDKKKKGVNLTDRYDNKENVDSNHDDSVTSPDKKSDRDSLAFGFSYNSDQLRIKIETLDNKLTDVDDVSCLTHDAVSDEGRNLVEFIEDKPLTRLPAGSLW